MAGLVGTAWTVAAQELRPTPGFWVRTGVALRTGYDVEFRDEAPALPSAAGQFANGFVLASVSTNSVYTWNWGYDGSAPPHFSGTGPITGTDLNLYRYDSRPRVGVVDGGSESTFGGELRVGFEALRFEVFERVVRFGLEGGYSFATLSATGGGSVSGPGSYTVGRYSLVGPGGQAIQPPLAPYAGTFDGPGPLIPLAPADVNTIVGNGISVAEFSLDADLHTFKFGPYFEMPLSKRWVVGLSFGYCTVLPDAEFRVRETTTFAGSDIPSISVDQVVRKSDWQPGGYLELRTQFEINRWLGLFLAAELQHNEDLDFGGAGRRAVVNLGTIFGASGGVRFAF